MSIPSTLLRRVQSALSGSSGQAAPASRLIDDGRRLWRRVCVLARQHPAADSLDRDAIELACLALQLPARTDIKPRAGRPRASNPRLRAGLAADMLAGLESAEDGDLIARAARILREVPRRNPPGPDAQLLADALNLDDFGVIGVFDQLIQLSRQGQGARQLLEGYEKREEYGYWDARLNEFHSDAGRELARRRLDVAREVCRLLRAELEEDSEDVGERR